MSRVDASMAQRYCSLMRILICVLSLLVSTAVLADDVYRWVDSHGVVHYSDKPPTKQAKPVALPPLQTYHSDSESDPFNLPPPTPEAAKPPPAPTPKIVQPADQATIRDPVGRIDVKVDVKLDKGQGLLYTVDGQARNKKPVQTTSFQLTGVYRGTHSIGVQLTDANGKVVSQAAPVTVYMKPPTVHHPR